MGKIRARTDEELAARKQEILAAAKEQFMTMSYESITLATIAGKTSISRPSMYHYYDKTESVLVDLIIQEYREWGEQMGPLLERRCSQEQFCQTMTDILWGHETLLKLLSLHLPIWDPSYDDSMLGHFANEILPFQNTLKEVVAFQFPDAGSKERTMFLIQFSVYCKSLYETKYLAQKPMDAAWKIRFLDFIPSASAVAEDQSIFCLECGAEFMAPSAEELAFNSQSKSYVKMSCEENNILTATVLLIQCYGDTLGRKCPHD